MASFAQTLATTDSKALRLLLVLLGDDWLPKYINWFRHVNPHLKEGPVLFPPFDAYKAFMDYIQLSGRMLATHTVPPPDSKLRVASICGHFLHPADPRENVDTCPTCDMDSCLARLRRAETLLQTIKDEGLGSKAIAGREVRSKAFVTVSQICQFEKMNWANRVHLYEQIAEIEDAWKEEGLEEVQDYHFTSASAAAVAAWMDYSSTLKGSSVTFVPASRGINAREHRAKAEVADDAVSSSPSSLPQKEKSKGSRRVVFSSDTVEHPIRGVNALFYRNSESYRPGRHACPDPRGWADTSFANKHWPDGFSAPDPDDSDSEAYKDSEDEDEDSDSESEDSGEWEDVGSGSLEGGNSKIYPDLDSNGRDGADIDSVPDGEDLSDLDVDEYLVSIPRASADTSRRRSREDRERSPPDGEDGREQKRPRLTLVVRSSGT